MAKRELGQALLFLIKYGPGRTEAELAIALYGPEGYQQQINQDCNMLVRNGEAVRKGAGGSSDPYKYFVSNQA